MTFTAPQERAVASHPQADNPERREAKYREDAASYIAAMLTELRQIAGKAGFGKLVAAVDAAYYEAYAAQGASARPAAEEPHEKLSHRMEQNHG